MQVVDGVGASAGNAGERPLTVLSVAYPFFPLSADSAGGAEQILALLDGAIVKAGHRSIVIAHEDSKVAGELVPIAKAGAHLDDDAVARTHAAVRDAIDMAVRQRSIDVVHVHGLDFDRYVESRGPPLVATLHLPVAWYANEALTSRVREVHLCCVSGTQSADMPSWAAPWRVIENGIALEAFRPSKRTLPFLLWLGRICEEKATHEALDAATAADMPLIVAGSVSGWNAHRRYFERYVVPRLRPPHRFVGPIGLARKRRLLAAAHCLLVTSRVPETSSLVAMEAAASGTPVIAYPAGALAHIVEPSRTGWLVNDAADMARAIGRAEELSRAQCRRTAEARFSARPMLDRYIDLYQDVAPVKPSRARAPQAAGSAARVHTDGALTVFAAEGIHALDALADEWIRLWERCPWATPFQRPEWLLPFASTFCGKKDVRRAWALAARSGGVLVALLPLSTQRGDSERTTLLGEPISDYLDILATAEAAQAATTRFLEVLGGKCADGSDVVLEPLRLSSPILSACVPRDLEDQVFEREPSPVLSLRGRLGVLSKGMTDRLRRARRHASHFGPLEFVDATDAGAVSTWLGHLFRLHASRWVTRGERGVLAAPEVRTFHDRAVPALARGGLARLYGLTLGGRAAAALLCFRDVRTVYLYASGFDPAFGQASPGSLLIGHAVEQAGAERAAEVDFLRGRERYKYAFLAEDRPSRARRLYVSSPSSTRAARMSSQTLAPVQPNDHRS